jgi:hypothetical protein
MPFEEHPVAFAKAAIKVEFKDLVVRRPHD